MRPKIVILLLGVTVGLVALGVLLRNGLARHLPEEPRVTEPTMESDPAREPNTHINSGSSNTAEMMEQLRVADVAKELDQVRELQAGGAGNPATTALLLGKVTHRESEVRKAAVEALVQLGDTNAVPGLEEAVGQLQDSRDKVALLDAIDYLKLSEIGSGGPSPGVAAADSKSSEASSGSSTNSSLQTPSHSGAKSRVRQPAVAPSGGASSNNAPPPR